jgi:SAM-dependent methyltransferase
MIMALFAIFGIPPSMLDIGSGTGAMVNLARKLGVDALGIDKIAIDPDMEHDLREPFNLGKTYALVTSIEVAEHIPESDSGVFVNSLCSHLARGGRLVFSAAPPSQPGDGHVHLKSASYWRSRIDKRGLSYREDLTVQLRMAWQWIPMPLMWIIGNVQVFER